MMTIEMKVLEGWLLTKLLYVENAIIQCENEEYVEGVRRYEATRDAYLNVLARIRKEV